jgi:hypothetical protein
MPYEMEVTSSNFSFSFLREHVKKKKKKSGLRVEPALGLMPLLAADLSKYGPCSSLICSELI